MEKPALRGLLRQQIRELDAAYLRDAGAAITRAVLSSAQYQAARTVFVYVSTPREPDTRAILADAWRSGKQVYVPKCRKKPHMDAIRVSGFGDLAPGTLGILEPAADASANDFSVLDLAVVPCVSASRQGRRLGHGGGYYDAFLAQFRPTTICLCLEALLRVDLPMERQDVWMDFVATEQGLFPCK